MTGAWATMATRDIASGRRDTDDTACAAALFVGETEMHARCRSLDWGATPLGPVSQWPTTLRVAASMVLAAGLPNIVLWGRDLTQLYNDSYARIIRAKHPLALGRGNAEVWPEVWHINGPIFERVFAGETVTVEDAHYPLERESADAPGRWTLEEAYLTISFSPIRDETGTVAGVLANMLETTSRVRERVLASAARIDERRQAYLVRLADALRHETDPVAVQATAARLLGEELDVHHAYYVEVGADDDTVVCAADWTNGAPSLVGRYALADFSADIAAEYRAGRTVAIDDVHTHPLVPASTRMAWEKIGIGAQLAVPLVKDGRFTAAPGVDQRTPRAWREEEIALVQETAARTWDAVERARTERALRESEARFRQMADAAPVPLWVTEADGHCSFLNRAWLTFTAQTLEQGLGFGWREAVHPDDVPDAARIVNDATERRAPFTIEYRLRRHDGTWHRTIVAAAPRLDAQGDFLGYVGSAVDVEERAALLDTARAALQQAEEAQRAAEAANRAKSEFLAVMSHELRTPLNAIGGYTDLIELGVRGAVTDDQRGDLARIRRAQRHLLGLINEVLNYARLESGAVHYEQTTVRACDALAAAEALVAPQAHAKGIALTVVECPATLVMRADADKVRQVLVNLLSNAIKFTEAGGRVTLTATARDDATAELSVGDTGIGIAADQLARIFEPFVQVRAELTRPHEGTGLGLAISRDLARGMGGDLTATSEPGAGSTFRMLLPRA